MAGTTGDHNHVALRLPTAGMTSERPEIGVNARIGILVVALLLMSCTHVQSEHSDAAGVIEWIGNKCGTELVIDDVADSLAALGGGYSALDPRREVLGPSLLLLKRALGKYPVDACQCASFNKLILVSQLKEEGVDQIGFTQLDRGTIVLSLDQDGKGTAYDLERKFHHEFFHLLDFAYDSETELDYEWISLNYEGFEYGSAASDLWYDPKRALRPTSRIRGFLSQYGTVSLPDDKAEVFSFLLTDPWFVDGRTVEDKIVAAKVSLLKRRLKNQCPALGLWIF
jgi:hypothetical protein